VEVVRHLTADMCSPAEIARGVRQEEQESAVIAGVLENRTTSHSSRDDVIQTTGDVGARSPGHRLHGRPLEIPSLHPVRVRHTWVCFSAPSRGQTPGPGLRGRSLQGLSVGTARVDR
jgi:hypothetical protein